MTFETAGTQTFFVTDLLSSTPSNTVSVGVDPATASSLAWGLPNSTAGPSTVEQVSSP
jgi:hypothetical protein